jgi:hypothetical protein
MSFTVGVGNRLIATFGRLWKSVFGCAYPAVLSANGVGNRSLTAPARFVDLAHGSPDAQARSEWSALISAAARGERAKLTPEGEAALLAIGGWHEVAYADTDRKLPRLERSFVKTYQDASESREMQRHTPALKNGPVSTTERGVNFPVALDIDA